MQSVCVLFLEMTECSRKGLICNNGTICGKDSDGSYSCVCRKGFKMISVSGNKTCQGKNWENRAIFIWVSKVICVFFAFSFLCLVIGWKKLAPLSQPIRSKPKTDDESWFAPASFSRLVPATWSCFEFWMDHWIVLRPLWLARVITLVWFYDTQLKTALMYQQISNK